MNPLKDMLLNMLKVADYYNKCNPTAAKPLNECIAFYLSSSIPMISSVVRDMKDKGLIDGKTERITTKGKSYIAPAVAAPEVQKMSNFQLACSFADCLTEMLVRTDNPDNSPHDFIPENSFTYHNWTEFATRWEEKNTPFLDVNMYFEDEQVDHLHEEPVEGDYVDGYAYLQQ